jgi:hypothetical protein
MTKYIFPEALERIEQERSDTEKVLAPASIYSGESNELAINLNHIQEVQNDALKNNHPLHPHPLRALYRLSREQQKQRLEGDYTHRPEYSLAVFEAERVRPIFDQLKTREDFPQIMVQIDRESARIADTVHREKLVGHMDYQKQHPSKTLPFVQA